MEKKISFGLLVIAWAVLLVNAFVVKPKVEDFGYGELSFDEQIQHYVVQNVDTTIVVHDYILESNKRCVSGIVVTYIKLEDCDYIVKYSFYEKEKLARELQYQMCIPSIYLLFLITAMPVLVVCNFGDTNKKKEKS